MTQVVRICRYGCNTQLSQFDTKQNKYLETDGTVHTKERCQELKQIISNNGNGNQDLSVQVLVKRLQLIGITIDLEKLRNLKV